MAQIYQNAYLTIAASSASDSSGGCFLDAVQSARSLHHHDPKTNILHELYIRPKVPEADLWDAPLNNRAWVLQEQILSPRVVHFTRRQFYWQCRTRFATEDGSVADSSFSSIRGDKPWTTRSFDLSTSTRSMLTWWQWVTEYSTRSLTDLGDQMAAMVGMTHYFQEKTSKIPVLGLWKDFMWENLAWKLQLLDDRAGNNLSRVPGIPTWSWLSVGPGTLVTSTLLLRPDKEDTYTNKAAVVEWDGLWSGPPYASKLLSSKLVVLGKMKSIYLLHTQRGRSRWSISSDDQSRKTFWDFDCFLDYDITSLERSSIYLLLLFASERHERVLVLSKVEDGKEGSYAYQRLGWGLLGMVGMPTRAFFQCAGLDGVRLV